MRQRKEQKGFDATIIKILSKYQTTRNELETARKEKQQVEKHKKSMYGNLGRVNGDKADLERQVEEFDEEEKMS